MVIAAASFSRSISAAVSLCHRASASLHRVIRQPSTTTWRTLHACWRSVSVAAARTHSISTKAFHLSNRLLIVRVSLRSSSLYNDSAPHCRQQDGKARVGQCLQTTTKAWASATQVWIIVPRD